MDSVLQAEVDKLLTAHPGRAVLVGVEGPIGGGKTTAAHAIRDYVGEKQTLVLSTDAYILVSRHRWDEFYQKADTIKLHEWYDLEKIRYTLDEARQRKAFDVEELYNLSNGQHDLTVHFDATGVRLVILEGLFALDETLRDELDLKVFIDVDRHVALERARQRDVVERNIDSEIWKMKEAIYFHGYNKYHDKHMALADVVIKQEN